MSTLILGAGVSGRAAAALLARIGEDCVVYDLRPDAVEVLAADGLNVFSGEWRDEFLAGIDLVVSSPGFNPKTEPIVAATRAGIPVWDEVELALQHLESPIAAVTGTNGKTTVVELTTAMLEGSGLKAIAAGNIGTAVSDIALEAWDAVVLELSSFQLARTTSLRPSVAIVLNVAPDHLDWHDSEESYRSAKARIFSDLVGGGVLIYDDDDAGATRLVSAAAGPKIPVSGSRVPFGGYGVSERNLSFPNGTVALSDVPAKDTSYRMDLVAAAVAARHLGATVPAVTDVIMSFVPSAHRRSIVGEWNEVVWINDSKATNPHAALAAIRSFSSVVLIAGGRNKGLDLAPLAQQPNVRLVVAMGESAPDLVEAAGADRSTTATTMGEAIEFADNGARAGDTVLLSPGCASFDMFSDYRERGDVFTRLVRERMEVVA